MSPKAIDPEDKDITFIISGGEAVKDVVNIRQDKNFFIVTVVT